MRKTPIDALPGQGETIIELRRAGVSAQAIGRYVGRSGAGIIHWLRLRGLWRSNRLTETDRARIDDLYFEEGWTLSAIGNDVGRHMATVQTYLTREGLHLPGHHWRTPAESERMAVWYDRGVAIDAILSHFNISRRQFYEHLRKCGREPGRRAAAPEGEELRRIVALYAAKTPINRIAAETRRARSTVVDALKRAGAYDPAQSAATPTPRPAAHPWQKGFLF